MSTNDVTSFAAARRYAELGWRPIPIPYKKKAPKAANWQHLRIAPDQVDQHFNGEAKNVGVLLGEASGWLIDVDLDHPLTVRLADRFLPPTAAKFGRASRRGSHWLYRCPGMKTDKFQFGAEIGMLVEIRSDGCQTIFPGSVHPSGESVEWDIEDAPAEIAPEALRASVARLASAALIVTRWPDKGARDDAAMALAGGLLRGGWSIDDTATFIEAVATTAGDDEVVMRVDKARGTAAKLVTGDEATGFPRLGELIGKDVVKAARKWLGLVEDWDVNKQGNRIASQRNLRRALDEMGVTLAHDEFAHRTLVRGLDGFGPTLDDAGADRFYMIVDERFRFRPSTDFLRRFLADEARRHTFHPVRDYLVGLTWDNVERLDRWLVTYAGAEDTDYVRAVGALTLVAAVRRVRRPGCKFDEMVVLEGTQGTGKSELLVALAVHDDWFSDDLPLNVGGKVVIERTEGRWIVEAAELNGMRRGDVEHLKALLSRRIDSARMAYGHLREERPRQFVVIGTTNGDRYLRDDTGNRRFWPVHTTRIDLDALKRDRDQLWAEAAQREAAGESIRLDSDLWADAAAEQEARRLEDPFEERLAELFGDLEGRITGAEVLELLDIPPGAQTQDHQKRMGAAMRRLNFERRKERLPGAKKPKWVFCRGEDPRVFLRKVDALGRTARVEHEPEEQPDLDDAI